MIAKELRMAAVEINQILRYTAMEDVNKIPLGMRNFFKEIEDDTYFPTIEPGYPIYKQKLLGETEKILGMFYCFYWGNEEELKDVSEEMKLVSGETEKKIYNSLDELNLMKTHHVANTEIAEVKKEPWYKKLFGWIKL